MQILELVGITTSGGALTITRTLNKPMRLVKVHWVNVDLASGVDATIKAVGSESAASAMGVTVASLDRTLLTLTNANSDAWYDVDELVGQEIRLDVADGGNAKKGGAVLYLEEAATGLVEFEAGNVFEVVFTTDTNAYAASDLAADTQEITSVVPTAGLSRVLMSIVLLDKADQKVPLDFVFLDSNQSLGTENSAPSVSDANAAAAVIGHVSIIATDYVDLGGCAVATKQCAVELKSDASTSLWVAIVNSTGTPTYAADSLVAKFGFLPS